MKYTVSFDNRSKEIILGALKKELNIAEDAIIGGDYTEESLIRHEEVLQLIRGILYSKPEYPTLSKQEVDKPDS